MKLVYVTFAAVFLCFGGQPSCRAQQTIDSGGQCGDTTALEPLTEELKALRSAVAEFKSVVIEQLQSLRSTVDELKAEVIACRNRSDTQQVRTNASFSCSIVVHTYSANTEPCTTPTYGNATINSQLIWKGAWCDVTATNNRGVNTFIIDPFNNCSHSDFHLFDTWASTANAQALAQYLGQVPDGRVILGISGDDAQMSISPALSTLASLGVDVSDVRFRGSFVFLVQKGFVGKTLFRKVLSNTEPYAHISARLQGSTIADLTFTAV